MTNAPRPVPRPVPGVPVDPDVGNWPVETRTAFLEELARYGNVTRAAREVGLHRGSLYALYHSDPEFAAQWQAALHQGVWGIVDEVNRRATEGVAKPVFHKGMRALDVQLDADGNVVTGADGEPVYRPAVVREYSDHLAVNLLRAHLPELFRDRVDVNHGGSVDAPSPTVDLTKLSTEELREFQRLLKKAAPAEEIDVTPVAGDDDAG